VEALRQAVVAILDFDVFGVDFHVLMQGDEGLFVFQVDQGSVEGDGAKTGFEARDAEQAVLGESDALDCEDLLRVDGLVDVHEVMPEAIDGIAILDFDNREVRAGEPVLAGVLRGSSLACGGAGAGGVLGVGSVGG